MGHGVGSQALESLEISHKKSAWETFHSVDFGTNANFFLGSAGDACDATFGSGYFRLFYYRIFVDAKTVFIFHVAKIRSTNFSHRKQVELRKLGWLAWLFCRRQLLGCFGQPAGENGRGRKRDGLTRITLSKNTSSNLKSTCTCNEAE